MKTLGDLLWASAAGYPAAPALTRAGAASGSTLSYAQLAALVKSGAARLRELPLVAGDRVLVFLEPGPEWVVALFSIWEAGLVPVPLPHQTPLPVAAALGVFAEVRAAVLGTSTSGLASLAGGVHSLNVAELARLERAPAVGCLASHPEVALIAFTSGSTDRPRAVELTAENLLSNVRALLEVRRAGPGDALLSMLPPAHLFGLTVGLLGPLACGARVVYPSSLLPNRLIAALSEDGITHALCVPALLDALYAEVLEELAGTGIVEAARRRQSVAVTAQRLRFELDHAARRLLRSGIRARVGNSLNTLIVGGAALDPSWVQIVTALGFRLEVGYGLTEASPIVSLGDLSACPASSVGRPLPGVQVRVRDGEIQVRGPNVMRGYFKDAETTAPVLEDGWLRTGDRGYLDAGGFLFITGRLKEAMVTAEGETLYPEEVEPCYASPLFAEFCVTGRTGPHGNDLPTLCVVPASPGIGPAELQAAFASLRAEAPPRLRVQGWVRLAGPLPRTATGKVRRRELARALQSGAPI